MRIPVFSILQILRRIVVVWLGGHSYRHPVNDEFNLGQDLLAAEDVEHSNSGIVEIQFRQSHIHVGGIGILTRTKRFFETLNLVTPLAVLPICLRSE